MAARAQLCALLRNSIDYHKLAEEQRETHTTVRSHVVLPRGHRGWRERNLAGVETLQLAALSWLGKSLTNEVTHVSFVLGREGG